MLRCGLEQILGLGPQLTEIWTAGESVWHPLGVSRHRFVAMSLRFRATLEMLNHGPEGREFGPEAFAFCTETGKKINSVKTAWRLVYRGARMGGSAFTSSRREPSRVLTRAG